MNEDTTGRNATAELAHEALIRSWSRFARWVDADAGFQRWLVTMEDRVAENELLPEARISEAERWLAERPDDIPTEVRDLVERSKTLLLQRIAELEKARNRAEEAARQAEEARHQAEEARHQVEEAARQRTRRQRQFIAALTALLMVAVGGVLFAFQQRATAQSERDTAIFNQITAQADRLRSTDVSLAAQLDLTAYRMRPTPDLYTALITREHRPVYPADRPHRRRQGGGVQPGWAHPGHRQQRPDGAVVERDRPGPPHTSGPTPDRPHRHRLLGGVQPGWAHPGQRQRRRDGAVVERDRPGPPHTLGPPLTGHTSAVDSVAFSPDGHTLASGSADRTVRLWNVTDPAHPTPLGPPLTGHTDAVFAVAFSPDGHTLASGSADQTVRLWNVTDPAHPTPLGPPLTGHTNTVYAVAFSPDGHTLASGSADKTVRLWNVTDPAHPTPLGQPLTGHTNYVFAVVFSPDGHTLASGSDDQTVRLWNVTDPAHPTPLGPPLTGHTNAVYAVAFSPDGHTLASGSADHTVRLWNIPSALIDRPHRQRHRGGVQPGWAYPGQRQRRPDGAVVERDRPGPPHTRWANP